MTAKMQLNLQELSSYSLEVLALWDKDKEKIRQLLSLHEAMQKVIDLQKHEIEKLKKQNADLKQGLSDMEKSNSYNDELRQKISELQDIALREPTHRHSLLANT